MSSTIQDMHNNSMNNLNKIHSLLSDCNDSATSVIEQLAIDREKLLKINNNVDKVDKEVNFSRKIVSKMNLRETKNKIMMGVGTCLATIGTILAVFLIKK